MGKNNSSIGCLIGLVILGLFMLLYNRLGYFYLPFSPMFITMIAGILIIGIMISAINSKHSNRGQSKDYVGLNPTINQIHLTNPYIIKSNQDSIPKERRQEFKTLPNEEKSAQYCQFCGVKREKDSIYCHNCGTRL